MAYAKECPNCRTNADNFNDDREFEGHVERCLEIRSSFNPRLAGQLFVKVKPKARSAKAGK